MAWPTRVQRLPIRMDRRAGFTAVLSLALMLSIRPGTMAAWSQTPRFHSSVLAQSGWTVAAFDDFSDPSRGILLRSSSDPSRYQMGYVGGEYQIARIDPNFDYTEGVVAPGSYDDAMISVDARMVGALSGGYPSLLCRVQPAGSYYRFSTDPSDSTAILENVGEAVAPLTRWTHSDAIRTGNQSNHLDLQCVGNTISGFVNGARAVSVQDNSYRTGRVGIQATNLTGVFGMFDARFQNLAVYRLAAQAAAPASPPASPTHARTTFIDSTRVRLDWTNNASNADGIQIIDAITKTPIRTLESSATTYTLAGLNPNQLYCVSVIPYNRSGSPGISDASCFIPLFGEQPPPPAPPPGLPGSLRATVIDSTRVRLDWMSTASDGGSLQILSFGPGSVARIAIVDSGTSTFMVTALIPWSHYCFYVQGLSQAPSSYRSNMDCADTPQE